MSIACIQGAYTIGVVSVIFAYYLRRRATYEPVHLHLLAVAIAHCLLIGATLISIVKGLYDFTHIWYWIISTAYVLSDISLLMVWKDVLFHRKNTDQ